MGSSQHTSWAEFVAMGGGTSLADYEFATDSDLSAVRVRCGRVKIAALELTGAIIDRHYEQALSHVVASLGAAAVVDALPKSQLVEVSVTGGLNIFFLMFQMMQTLGLASSDWAAAEAAGRRHANVGVTRRIC